MQPHCFAQRIEELLSDGYMLNDRRAEVRLTSKGVAKLHQLIHEGYLIMANRTDNVRLTEKGVAVLLACADRPSKPKREIKKAPIQRKGD